MCKTWVYIYRFMTSSIISHCLEIKFTVYVNKNMHCYEKPREGITKYHKYFLTVKKTK